MVESVIDMGIHEPEQFTYERTWDDIENMLGRAELKLNYHHTEMSKFPMKSKRWMEHARNFKALQGVVKTLRWTLGDRSIPHPLE